MAGMERHPRRSPRTGASGARSPHPGPDHPPSWPGAAKWHRPPYLSIVRPTRNGERLAHLRERDGKKARYPRPTRLGEPDRYRIRTSLQQCQSSIPVVWPISCCRKCLAPDRSEEMDQDEVTKAFEQERPRTAVADILEQVQRLRASVQRSHELRGVSSPRRERDRTFGAEEE